MDSLSLEALAEATDESPARLRHWHSLGLLPGASAEAFAPECIERVRLIQFASGRGISAETLAEASAEQGDLLGQYLPLLAPGGPRATYALSDAAAQLDIDPAIVTRIAEVIGLDGQDFLYQDDLQALSAIRTALAAGFPEEAIVQLTRVLTDALNRVAEAETRLFHFYVHEPLREQGIAGDELIAAQQVVNDQLLGLVEPTVLYFHRRGWERALREDLMLHLAKDLALSREPGQLHLAVAFVDLASFTPLSQAMGDATAARVLERFATLVRSSVRNHAGNVVKQIGDAFMLTFPDASSAIGWALEIEKRASTEAKFPALRIGIHAGPVLYRDGDYIGTNVNIAARVAAEADRHQVLVTGAVVGEAAEDLDVAFETLGRRQLKGLIDEVELFRVQPRGEPARRAIDPVCGMEVDADDAAVKLTWEGRDLLFCSIECLQRFSSAPERYTITL